MSTKRLFVYHLPFQKCVKRPLSRRLKIGFQDQLSLNAGQKFCRILKREHSAIQRSLICLFLSGCFIQDLLYFFG